VFCRTKPSNDPGTDEFHENQLISTIEQKYFEAGHNSIHEVDSIHSKAENYPGKN
jgi:hypothetical protein